MTKTILVFGATGCQGGSVVKHLLKSNMDIKIRALTRHKDAEEARCLKEKCPNVELVEGDMCGTLDDAIFRGVDCCFLLTDSWDQSQKGSRECEVGKSVVDRIVNAGINHIIFSTLPNVEKLSGGKYNVPMFTNKALIEEYIRSKNFKICNFVSPAFYYQNFQTWFAPQQSKDGNLTITMPHTETLTAVDVDDVGAVVVKILQNPEKLNNQIIPLQGQHGEPLLFVKGLEKKLGKPVKLNLVSGDEFLKMGIEGGKDLVQMFGWFNEYTYFGTKIDRDCGKQLHQFKDFETWLQGVDFKVSSTPSS